MGKLLVLSVLTVVGLLAGACGSSEDGGSAARTPEGPTAVETVQVAYQETAAEQTAKTSFEVKTSPPMDLENPGRPGPVTTTGQGVVDFSGAASSMTMEMFGMGSFEVRQIGSTAYIKMPEDLAAQMPDAKPWIEADLKEPYAQNPGEVPGQMRMGEAEDPTRQLEYLRGVSDSVEKVGMEKVRGVRTTRYEAVVDLERGAAGRGGPAREAQDEMVEGLGASKLPVEVWLDEQKRVRRYALDVTVPAPENAASPEASRGGATMRTQMIAEYYDFGTPIDVQVPPPEQTMDGSKLLSGQPVAR